MESSTYLDHRATWNEVCEALEFSWLDAYECNPVQEACSEVALGCRGDVRFTSEEFVWLALAKEAQNSAWN